MPSSSHCSRFYHPNNIGWAVQIIKLLVMYFSPLPCYLFPLTVGCYLQKHKLNEDVKRVLWAVQIIKLLVMYFSPLPCYYYLQKHKLNEDVKRVFSFIFLSKLHAANIKLHVVRIKLICVCECVRSYCSWYLRRFLGTMFYQVEASNGKGATRGHPGHQTSLSHIRCLSSTKLFLYKKDITFRGRGQPTSFPPPSPSSPEISDSLTFPNRWRYFRQTERLRHVLVSVPRTKQ